MGRQLEAFPVGEPIESHLTVVRPTPPGVHELGAIGEDKKHPGRRNAPEQHLQYILGTPVDPVEVLDPDDEGAELRPLEDNSFQGFLGPIFPGLRAHGDLIDPAVLDGEQLQKIGQRRSFIYPHDLDTLGDLFPDLRVGIVILNVEIGSQKIDDGMVGDIAAVREASALEKNDFLVGHGFSEFVEEPGFADSRVGYDGDSLTPSFPGSLETVQQEFQLPFPADEGSKSPFGADVEPGPTSAWSDYLVYLYRFLFSFDFLFPQGLESEEALGELKGVPGDIGGSRLRVGFHPGSQVDRVSDGGEFNS